MEQFLYLTTTGRKSNRPHEIEIWYVQHGDCYYLIAEGREQAHWVQNIRTNPAIRFHVGGNYFRGWGRIPTQADDANLIQTVSKLMDEKYGWSDGLIVELCSYEVLNKG